MPIPPVSTRSVIQWLRMPGIRAVLETPHVFDAVLDDVRAYPQHLPSDAGDALVRLRAMNDVCDAQLDTWAVSDVSTSDFVHAAIAATAKTPLNTMHGFEYGAYVEGILRSRAPAGSA